MNIQNKITLLMHKLHGKIMKVVTFLHFNMYNEARNLHVSSLYEIYNEIIWRGKKGGQCLSLSIKSAKH